MCLGFIEENNKVVTKLRFSNTKQRWSDFLRNEDDIDILITDAGSVSERTLRYLEDLNVQVNMVHPKKARSIAETTIKADELDAESLIDLEKVGVLSEIWIPPRENIKVRHLCK